MYLLFLCDGHMIDYCSFQIRYETNFRHGSPIAARNLKTILHDFFMLIKLSHKTSMICTKLFFKHYLEDFSS